ncbi:MAG: MFS transporter [Rhizobiaceae bacterium]
MAVGTVFFCFGILMGLWGGSLAEVARLASASPETIGSAFFAYSIAGIVGMAFAGRIGRRISLKIRLLVLLLMAGACLAALFQVTNATALIIGLAIFSFVASSVDLVMNAEAIAVEHDRRHPVLAGFHGLASLGVGFGAIAGSYLSVTHGVAATTIANVVVTAAALIAVLFGTPNRGATHPVGHGSTWFVPAWPLVALGLIVGASIAGEIASTMFSTQALESHAPNLAAYAGIGATAFAFVQGGVRMVGDRLRRTFGDERLIRMSLATATVGFVVVTLSPTFTICALGFALVGLGTACIVPSGFALAASMSARPAAAVISMLAIITGVARIPAPLIYGWVAESTTFASAFLIYALIVAGGFALSFAVGAKSLVRSTI